MANINLNQRYGVAAAENGKFAPIDMSSLSPSYSGDGRFAVLTYQINAVPVSLSGDITVAETIPNTTLYESIEIPSATLQTINFSNTVSLLEVYNNSTEEPIYITFNPDAAHAIEGLPITPETFYSISRDVDTFYLANPSDNNVDVRIIGHYRV